MSAPGSLLELRDRARAARRSSLLDAPIEDACGSLGDAELTAIVRFVAEKLSLGTLDALLSSPDAERAFQRALSPTVRARLVEAIERALFRGEGHPLRVAIRDEKVDVLELPRTAAGIEAWAREAGVEERLDQPASSVLVFVESGAHLAKHPFDAAATVLDVLQRRRLPSSATSAATLADAARRYLAHHARLRAIARTREARWAAVPEARALRAAARRVHERLELTPAHELPPVVERLTQVEVEPAARTFLARFTPPSRAESRAVVEATVPMAEPESARCACPRGAPCGHVAEALAALLDVLHDPTHGLHAALVSSLEPGRSSPLVRRLAELEDEPEVPAKRAVVYRIDLTAKPYGVSAHLRRRGRESTAGAGAALPFPKLLGELRSDEAEHATLAALAIARASGANAALERAFVSALFSTCSVAHPDDPKRFASAAELALAVRIDGDESGYALGFSLGETRLSVGDVAGRAVAVAFDAPRERYVYGRVDPRLSELATAAAEAPALAASDAEATADRLLGLRPPVPLVLPPALAGDEVEPDARLVVGLSPLGDGGLDVELRARPLPEGPAFAPGDGPPLLVAMRAGHRVHVRRDAAQERREAEVLEARLELDRGTPRDATTIRFAEPDEALALVERISLLADAVRVEWPKGQKPLRAARATREGPTVRARHVGRFLGIDGELETDQGSVPLAHLVRAVRAGRAYVALEGGAFLRIEASLRARIEQTLEHAFETEDGLAIAEADVGLLEQVDPSAVASFDRRVRALRDRVLALAGNEPPPPALTGTLREYQTEGYRFLARHAALGFGALLADEMGLGKTLQALALLCARGSRGPALVVAPTSVVGAWAEEAARFAPQLAVQVHLGQRRTSRAPVLGPNDVLVTSYEILARDVELLEACPFATAVFDEAHFLKNVRTKRAEAARRIDAEARVGLTGTPLENHLADVFGIFDVLSPGLLGTAVTFRDRYALPAERDNDADARKRLRDRLAPFVLRRTKADVAIELPDRIEIERAVELSPEESLLYEAARRDAVAELAQADGPLTRRRFAVLSALTRLRQLACHPRLVDPSSPIPSSKLESFLELAHDLVREGHRVLVFSQFVRHLDLVREALDASGYDSLRLDGSTPAKERTERVRRFQEGDVPFFLISLKAGGTGLNLTAADYVVHLDPWWNPASEDQASDRAHRIGQTQPVTIVRLVTDGTIERAVLALHREKRGLADAILSESSRIGRVELEDLARAITESGSL